MNSGQDAEGQRQSIENLARPGLFERLEELGSAGIDQLASPPVGEPIVEQFWYHTDEKHQLDAEASQRLYCTPDLSLSQGSPGPYRLGRFAHALSIIHQMMWQASAQLV